MPEYSHNWSNYPTQPRHSETVQTRHRAKARIVRIAATPETVYALDDRGRLWAKRGEQPWQQLDLPEEPEEESTSPSGEKE